MPPDYQKLRLTHLVQILKQWFTSVEVFNGAAIVAGGQGSIVPTGHLFVFNGACHFASRPEDFDDILLEAHRRGIHLTVYHLEDNAPISYEIKKQVCW